MALASKDVGGRWRSGQRDGKELGGSGFGRSARRVNASWPLGSDEFTGPEGQAREDNDSSRKAVVETPWEGLGFGRSTARSCPEEMALRGKIVAGCIGVALVQSDRDQVGSPLTRSASQRWVEPTGLAGRVRGCVGAVTKGAVGEHDRGGVYQYSHPRVPNGVHGCRSWGKNPPKGGGSQ